MKEKILKISKRKLWLKQEIDEMFQTYPIDYKKFKLMHEMD
jgi:hypothetical protein